MKGIILCLLLLCNVQSTQLKQDWVDFKSNYKEVSFFLETKLTDSVVFKALLYYNIKHPKIVLNQSILETGNYRSKLCLEGNNLFGICGKNGKYIHFNHWTESILSYKKIQSRYKPKCIEEPNSYYDFLIRIKYAEDNSYIQKLKQMTNE